MRPQWRRNDCSAVHIDFGQRLLQHTSASVCEASYQSQHFSKEGSEVSLSSPTTFAVPGYQYNHEQESNHVKILLNVVSDHFAAIGKWASKDSLKHIICTFVAKESDQKLCFQNCLRVVDQSVYVEKLPTADGRRNNVPFPSGASKMSETRIRFLSSALLPLPLTLA